MESSDVLLARFLALHPKTIDLSLGRIERLLAKLGHPERRLPPVIHVAGTNGKGSTIAFMRAILEAAGLVVHVYTSPHLVRFHERIRLGQPGGGRLVGEADLMETFRHCEAVNAGEPVTFFEMTTAAALVLFSQRPADVLLLEVGLGGRCDATNVVSDPAATVVTPVSLDHADFLGDRVTLIAAEKAGIFKKGAPAVIAPQDPEPAAVLKAQAAQVGARPFVGGLNFTVHEENGRLVYRDERDQLDLPTPRLPGRHQHVNAGTAIAALRAAGFGSLPASAFETGMLQVDWPARLQHLTRGRLIGLLPEGADLWLDGGHNPDGGRALAAAMAELEEKHPAPLVIVCGTLGTKDAEGFLLPFKGMAKEVLAVPILSQAAARRCEEVAAIARHAGLQASHFANVEAALASTRNTAWERPPRVLIAGSLYLAGEVLAENGTPPQ
ncbi:bifunctional folylpolyglutamate synthase/dihydrofolate synthase [Pseudochelatococcus sp. B33]